VSLLLMLSQVFNNPEVEVGMPIRRNFLPVETE
jgi:hypothetical protein